MPRSRDFYEPKNCALSVIKKIFSAFRQLTGSKKLGNPEHRRPWNQISFLILTRNNLLDPKWFLTQETLSKHIYYTDSPQNLVWPRTKLAWALQALDLPQDKPTR